MGLPALEFSECCLDSPQFRERLRSHEAELEKTNKFIKELIKDGKSLIAALKNLSSAKRKFADSLNEFKFRCIGDAETDDEICIAKSLQEFATVLRNLEDERMRMIENASEVLITPLEKFRKEQIGAAKDAKKKYDKETEKYCGVLEKHLNLSSKKKESQLQEADSQVDLVRQHFYEVSLEYVFKVQEVQERKMFEFVEPLLAFLQGLFTFYHHGYELAKDFSDFKTELTISIQNTRNRFEGTRSEVESLMKKMKENPHEHKNISPYTMEGYLYVQEKRHFGTSWVKHYCTYQRESKRITMVPFDQKSGGKGGEDEAVILKSCTRRKTDSIEKRFCFDVEAVDRPGVITMQALSEEDRRLWMEAMDGREPDYSWDAAWKWGLTWLFRCDGTSGDLWSSLPLLKPPEETDLLPFGASALLPGHPQEENFSYTQSEHLQFQRVALVCRPAMLSSEPGSAFVMPCWCEGCSQVPTLLNKPLLQAKWSPLPNRVCTV